ncbi:DNA fragmentation factor subunit alpha [Clupea harengus]|uniref:DNAation factor subunit alpha n=1 Tax=Clupea harengus TaxID=7950 RepID=A0A6P3VVK3_CLUHA|nr:DNA fragmentation factor subunit alpha [Clupea harengus]
MAEVKPCKVCNFSRQKSYGLVVSSLDQLKVKGGETLGIAPEKPVSVVLEDDGTIVEDDAYFLCLPSNTKFMLLHGKEAWGPTNKIDGGTAWLSRESVALDGDEVDMMFSGTDTWQSLAAQLKQDLASIILLSDSQLQTLMDVPCANLASALGFQQKKAQALQDTLQTVLDRREESRQSKELLQLYLKTVESEREQEASQEAGGDVMDETDGMEVDSGSGFMSRTLMVLKGKTSPETRLSNQELQMVVNKGAASMEQVLGLEADRTATLVQACEAELEGRLQQVQALKSLSAQSQQASDALTTEDTNQSQAKRSK